MLVLEWKTSKENQVIHNKNCMEFTIRMLITKVTISWDIEKMLYFDSCFPKYVSNYIINLSLVQLSLSNENESICE